LYFLLKTEEINGKVNKLVEYMKSHENVISEIINGIYEMVKEKVNRKGGTKKLKRKNKKSKRKQRKCRK